MNRSRSSYGTRRSFQQFSHERIVEKLLDLENRMGVLESHVNSQFQKLEKRMERSARELRSFILNQATSVRMELGLQADNHITIDSDGNEDKPKSLPTPSPSLKAAEGPGLGPVSPNGRPRNRSASFDQAQDLNGLVLDNIRRNSSASVAHPQNQRRPPQQRRSVEQLLLDSSGDEDSDGAGSDQTKLGGDDMEDLLLDESDLGSEGLPSLELPSNQPWRPGQGDEPQQMHNSHHSRRAGALMHRPPLSGGLRGGSQLPHPPPPPSSQRRHEQEVARLDMVSPHLLSDALPASPLNLRMSSQEEGPSPPTASGPMEGQSQPHPRRHCQNQYQAALESALLNSDSGSEESSDMSTPQGRKRRRPEGNGACPRPGLRLTFGRDLGGPGDEDAACTDGDRRARAGLNGSPRMNRSLQPNSENVIRIRLKPNGQDDKSDGADIRQGRLERRSSLDLTFENVDDPNVPNQANEMDQKTEEEEETPWTDGLPLEKSNALSTEDHETIRRFFTDAELSYDRDVVKILLHREEEYISSEQVIIQKTIFIELHYPSRTWKKFVNNKTKRLTDLSH